MSKRLKRSKGSLMVESSLILLVFLTTLIGTADIAQFLFIHQTLTERVRNAARYGSVNPYDATVIRNLVMYNETAPSAGASPFFNISADMIAVTRMNAGTPEDRIVVTVSNYPFVFITPFIAGTARGLPITACVTYEPQ
jgi:hypothetical protein